MKRIKHNDLTHYFLRDREDLSRAYLASCEKFFRELKNPGVIAAVQEAKAASSKQMISDSRVEASQILCRAQADPQASGHANERAS